ncbi:hypothetical protein [Burkholderia multivorans]|uniref:hypothetical protein n=1 Tax=Burkholderia multivorans TaxID=87883 RepID=UPI002158AB59|nr:hypothetical protein [Burkholderia multivorans]
MDHMTLFPRITNSAPVTTAVMDVLAANHTKNKLRGDPCRSSGGMKSIERRSMVAVFIMGPPGCLESTQYATDISVG